ncbi:MAG: hypothetical protein GXY43_08325 [Clostridiaceae bacterium]|nr:hypothetical protein [Clostridiaceae bacterium]
MRRKIERILSVWLVVCMILILSSCRGKADQTTTAETNQCNVFQASYIELPTHENRSVRADCVIATEEHIVFLQGWYTDPNDALSYRQELVWTDKVGNVQATHPADGFYGRTTCLFALSDTVFVIGSDEFGYCKAREYGLPGVSGNAIEWNIQNQNVEDAVLVGDTWAFIYAGGRVELFRDGKSIYTRPGHVDDIFSQRLVVQDNKIIWLSTNYKGDTEWVILDPASLSEKIVPVKDNILSVSGAECNSAFGYFYEAYDVVEQYDPETSSVVDFMSVLDTDIPPSRYQFIDDQPYVLDGDHIVYLNNPGTDSSACDPVEVVLLTRLDKNPHEGKTILTLGGHGVSSYNLICRAVYQFNTTHSDTRIRLRDYAYEYPYDSRDSFHQTLATLISDLSSGKGDDIITEGAFFDFSYLGEIGALVDMMPYLEKDPDLSADRWLPSIFELMKSGDSLYRFFPGFMFYGYFGNSTLLTGHERVSAEEMTRLSESLPSETILFPGITSSDLIVASILYDLEYFIDENGEFRISEEQMQALIDYALECGLAELPTYDYSTTDKYVRGKQVLFYSLIANAQMYHGIEQLIPEKTVFVGSPTLSGTAYICVPSTSLAISDATEHPEECWEFIKTMMLPEVQQSIIETGYFPVGASAFESFMEQAMHPEIRTPSEDTGLDLLDKSAVPEDCVERLRGIIDSLNTTGEIDDILSQIITEECTLALAGQKTAAETAKVLSDRVNLYLQSRKR